MMNGMTRKLRQQLERTSTGQGKALVRANRSGSVASWDQPGLTAAQRLGKIDLALKDAIAAGRPIKLVQNLYAIYQVFSRAVGGEPATLATLYAQAGRPYQPTRDPFTNAPVSSAPSVKPTLTRGMSGSDVVLLQRFLQGAGQPWVTADGDFGEQTEGAVQQFQMERGLSVTGVVDGVTWRALEARTGTGRMFFLTATGQSASEVQALYQAWYDAVRTSQPAAEIARLRGLYDAADAAHRAASGTGPDPQRDPVGARRHAAGLGRDPFRSGIPTNRRDPYRAQIPGSGLPGGTHAPIEPAKTPPAAPFQPPLQPPLQPDDGALAYCPRESCRFISLDLQSVRMIDPRVGSFHITSRAPDGREVDQLAYTRLADGREGWVVWSEVELVGGGTRPTQARGPLQPGGLTGQFSTPGYVPDLRREAERQQRVNEIGLGAAKVLQLYNDWYNAIELKASGAELAAKRAVYEKAYREFYGAAAPLSGPPLLAPLRARCTLPTCRVLSADLRQQGFIPQGTTFAIAATAPNGQTVTTGEADPEQRRNYGYVTFANGFEGWIHPDAAEIISANATGTGWWQAATGQTSGVVPEDFANAQEQEAWRLYENARATGQPVTIQKNLYDQAVALRSRYGRPGMAGPPGFSPAAPRNEPPALGRVRRMAKVKQARGPLLPGALTGTGSWGGMTRKFRQRL